MAHCRRTSLRKGDSQSTGSSTLDSGVKAGRIRRQSRVSNVAMKCRRLAASGIAILCVCAATKVLAQDDSSLRLFVLVPEPVMTIVFREHAARWASPAQRTAVRNPTMISARKIKDVPPVYPAAARAADVSGMVIVQIVVDETGTVGSATIVRSIPLLDQAAIDCVKQWRFTPALANGSPVPSTMVVTVTFGPKR